MKRVLLTTLFLLASATPALAAEKLFTAIDEVKRGIDDLTVVGLGEADEAQTFSARIIDDKFRDTLSSCERLLLLAAERPGRYHVVLEYSNFSGPVLDSCKLKRAKR